MRENVCWIFWKGKIERIDNIENVDMQNDVLCHCKAKQKSETWIQTAIMSGEMLFSYWHLITTHAMR